jgi:hypothetical protein
MSAAASQQMTEWLRRAPQVPGTLVRAVRLADAQLVQPIPQESNYPVKSLELAWRVAADTFEVLTAQRFPPTRLSWVHDQSVFHCVRRLDGAIFGIILARQQAHADPMLLEKLFGEFLRLPA